MYYSCVSHHLKILILKIEVLKQQRIPLNLFCILYKNTGGIMAGKSDKFCWATPMIWKKVP